MTTSKTPPTTAKERLWTDKGIDYILARLTNQNIEHKDELIEGAIDIIRELRSVPPAPSDSALAELKAKVETLREQAHTSYRNARGPMATHQASERLYPAGKYDAFNEVLNLIRNSLSTATQDAEEK